MKPGQAYEFWEDYIRRGEDMVEVGKRKIACVQITGQLALFLAYRSSWKLHEDYEPQASN